MSSRTTSVGTSPACATLASSAGSQGTAVFVGFFESEDKMRAAEQVFEQMDASETPGTRASVDNCEVKIERDA
jgi:hypothetical protein